MVLLALSHMFHSSSEPPQTSLSVAEECGLDDPAGLTICNSLQTSLLHIRVRQAVPLIIDHPH
jgi:hypothetical protein